MTRGYLIRGGDLYDGSSGPRCADVRIVGETIDAIGDNLPADDCQVIDAAGLIVCPGLIDLHVHCFDGAGLFSVPPAAIGLKTGVTTMLDTGSAGALHFAAFHKYVMPAAAEDVFALLHIVQIGCHGNVHAPPYFGELSDIRFACVDRAVECVERFGDRILGMKVRLTASLAEYKPSHERIAMHRAIEAAQRTGLPCMFHHKDSAIAIDEALAALRPGDVYTHMYHPGKSGPFDEDGRPHPATLEARQRGVRFDVGHGIGSFAWRVAERACREHGFWPDSISTDLHRFCIDGPVCDLPTTMSKFLHLGMPLEQIIAATTSRPAAAMRRGDRFGTLAPGRQADVTVLRIERGRCELTDVRGETRTAEQRLVPVQVFKAGRHHPVDAATPMP